MRISRRISSILAISMIVLMVAYFVLLQYPGKLLPLPTFVEVKRIYTNALAIGFFALLPVLAISHFSQGVRVIFLILAVPLCCMFSYIATSLPEHVLTSAELANYRYHLTVQSSFAEIDVVYTLYECNTSNLECAIVYTDLYRGDVRGDDLAVDEKTNEVQYIRNDRLVFAYGKESREVLASEQLGEFLYYVAVYPPYGSIADKHTYSLYQCEADFTECHKLPFRYTDTGGSFNLTLDDKTQELNVYEWKYNTDDILIYSYGSEPKCYVEQCSIPNQ